MKVSQMLERSQLETSFDRIDRAITRWMARYGLIIMRVGLGVVFFWFGALKLVPGLSPAEELVRNTTYFVDPDLFLPVLAIWEMLIGLGLILGRFMRVPEAVWTEFPHGLTLEGQYIVKNLVLIGAGLVLGGTVRGGRLDPEPARDR
jgi:uncharacterized membrane protein YkgB